MTMEISSILIYTFLILFCITFQASYTLFTAGVGYGFSNRQNPQPNKGKLGYSIDQTLGNLKEGAVVYLPLALLAVSLGASNPYTHYSALMTILSRAVYVPVCLSGIRVLRTIVWTPSFIAIPVMTYGIYVGLPT